MRFKLLMSVLLMAAGCAATQPKPPKPEIQTLIESRLIDYSESWFRGDAKAVAGNFLQMTGAEKDFARAIGQLAVAQQQLVAVQPSIPQNFSGIGSRSEPIIELNRPWPLFAASAARPPQQTLQVKDTVTAQLSGADITLTLVQSSGHWLIQPDSFGPNRPLALITDSVDRQTRLTRDATKAIQEQKWDVLKSILQQMHQQQMVDRISDSTDTRVP